MVFCELTNFVVREPHIVRDDRVSKPKIRKTRVLHIPHGRPTTTATTSLRTRQAKHALSGGCGRPGGLRFCSSYGYEDVDRAS